MHVEAVDRPVVCLRELVYPPWGGVISAGFFGVERRLSLVLVGVLLDFLDKSK